MVMMTVQRCMEVAASKPDLSSVEFRNAVSTMNARVKASKCPALIAEAEAIRASLLAHGAPQAPPKLTPEERAEICRTSGQAARLVSCKAALRRKLDAAPNGFLSVTDRKPTVFDAALELIEDEEVSCVYQTTETVYAGPMGPEGRRAVRRVTIVRPNARPTLKAIREGVRFEPKPCQWASERRQKQEAQI